MNTALETATKKGAHGAILKVLQEMGRPIGGKQICDQLLLAGIRVRPRTIRLRLKEMDRDGLTRLVSRRSGRELTELGREELLRTNVVRKIGFVAAKIDTLVCRMTFDADRGAGAIVTNVSRIPRRALSRAMEGMKIVFDRGLTMGTRLRLSPKGPSSKTSEIATICSVTVNGVLLKKGIPVSSRFGGLLEIHKNRPLRFVEIIEYRSTTLDPLEIFIQARMTSVGECAKTGSGLVGASFREFPSVALPDVLQAKGMMEKAGLGGILLIGRPGQPLLDIPVGEGLTGMIVVAGLNAIAALREEGIEVELESLAGLEDFGSFSRFEELYDRWYSVR